MNRSVGHLAWQVVVIALLGLSHVRCGKDEDQGRKEQDKNLEEPPRIDLSEHRHARPKPGHPQPQARPPTRPGTSLPPAGPMVLEPGKFGRPIPGGPLFADAKDTPSVGLVRAYADRGVDGPLVVAADGRHALYRHAMRIKAVDLSTGKIVRDLPCPTRTVLALSPDSRHALVTGVSLVDLETGKTVAKRPGTWNRAVFAPDAKKALLCSGRQYGRSYSIRSRSLNLYRWDLQTDQITQMPGHVPGTTCEISSDGGLAADTSGPQLRVYRIAEAKLLCSFPRPTPAGPVAFTPSGLQLLAPVSEALRLWDLASGSEVWRYDDLLGKGETMLSAPTAAARGSYSHATFEPHPSSRTCRAMSAAGRFKHVAVTPQDGAYAVTSHEDNTLRVWRLPNPGSRPLRDVKGVIRERATILGAHQAAFSPDGGELAFAAGRQTRTVPMPDLVQRIATVTATGSRWYQPAESLGASVRDGTAVMAMRYFGDSRTLAVLDMGKSVRLVGTDVKRQLTSLPAGRVVRAMAISPDGRRIATNDSVDGVALWSAPSSAAAERLHRTGAEMTSLAFSPDGRLLAVAAVAPSGPMATIWSVELKTRLAILFGHGGKVNRIVFSPDGTWLATGGEDRTVRIWSVSGRPLATLTGHRIGVTAIAVSPDGAVLASAAGTPLHRGELKIWDVKTRTLLAEPRGHRLSVLEMCFSPDGRWLATSGWDAAVKLWELTPPRPAAGASLARRSIPQTWRGVASRSPLGPESRYPSELPDPRVYVPRPTVSPDRRPAAPPDMEGAPPSRRPAAPSSRYPRRTPAGDLEGVRGRRPTKKLRPRERPASRKPTLPGKPKGDRTFRVVLAATVRLGAAAAAMALSRSGESLAIQTGQGTDALLLVDLAKLVPDGIPRPAPAGEIEVKTISRQLRSAVPGAGRDGAVKLAFLGNDRTLAVVRDGRLAFLDTQSGQPIAAPPLRGVIRGMSLCPRGTVLVIVTSGKLYLYSSPSVRKEYPCSSIAGRAAASPGAALLAYYVNSATYGSIGYISSGLHLWDIRKRKFGGTLRALSRITALAFSPQGGLAVANGEGKVQLWSTAPAAMVSEQSTNGEPISAVAYSPHSRHVLTASDEAIAVWDAGNGEAIAVVSPGQKGISHLALTPDGRWLLSLAADGTLKVWRVSVGAAGKTAPAQPRDARAAKKLELARLYLKNAANQQAERVLRQIVREYAGTAEAKEAARLIETLTAPATRPSATQPGKTKAGKGSGS